MKPISQDQHSDVQRSINPSPQQPLAFLRRPLSLVFQWLFVVCFGLGLFFLLKLHAPGPFTSTPVDQIPCDQGEQLAFHIHAHLSIFLDGQAVTIPAAVGIAPSGCLYWLHTHISDGIIHIEAPDPRSFVLGNFLDIWKQQFAQLNYPKAFGLTAGWRAFVNGKLVTGNFRTISLKAHALITLAYHSPDVRPDTLYNWGNL